MRRFLSTLWAFCRPHTITGTTLSVLSLYLLAAIDVQHWPSRELLVTALLATWGGNVYIVGLNQIIDLELDRINKPFLPLPSGRLSLTGATITTLVAGAAGLVFSALSSVYLFAVLVISMMLGTAYSLPPVRLKRFPFWSSFCILAVRGVVVNLGLYWHFLASHSSRTPTPPHLLALVGFMIGLSMAIAWFKDVPDVAGDRQFRIFTLAVRLGARRILHLGRAWLTLVYLAIIVWGFMPGSGLQPPAAALFHGGLLGWLHLRASGVNPANQVSLTRYYRFIWWLFYLEYIGYPLLHYLH